jgi:hypothetical protein
MDARAHATRWLAAWNSHDLDWLPPVLASLDLPFVIG